MTQKPVEYGFELDELAAGFTPPKRQQPGQQPEASKKALVEAARAAGYSSREPAPDKEPEGQLSIRAKASLIEEFKLLAKQQEPKWNHGYLLQRALAALRRELAG